MLTSSLKLFLLLIVASSLCLADDAIFLKNTVKKTVENLGRVPGFGEVIKPIESCNLTSQVEVKNNWIIPVNISLGANLGFSADDIKEAVKEAANCWNTALENANRKTFKVSIDIKQIITLTDETGVIGNINQPALDDLGNPLKECSEAYKASEFNLVISNKIERSHIKEYWNKNINLNLRKKALQVGKLSIECDRIHKEELAPLNLLSGSTTDETEYKKIQIKREIISKRFDEVCNQLTKEQDDLKRELPNLPDGNLVYLSPEKSKEELARTIAHELGHAWGGLADRYKGSPESRQKNKINLMGLSAECNIEKAQITSIERYQKTGEVEVFDSK